MRHLLASTVALGAMCALFGLAFIPTGMSLAQDIAVACIVAVLVLGLLPGRTSRLFFVSLCAWVVVRYIAWRFSSLPLDNGLASSMGAIALLLAELYGVSMLLLGLFVNAWPLERRAPRLPKNKAEWPTVDVYIPTYSEPVSVVASTVMAALEIDYPKDKFTVYVLDDGHPRSKNPATDPRTARELAERSRELQALCERHGAKWLTREKNEHAKSGNMNTAMKSTTGEFILILDADHVPTRNILKNTVGFMVRDSKLAFVQTPHFFLNSDPVEKNLTMTGRMPAESDMFYRVVQKGLDLWNTAMFCGSAALLRRTAIVDVGGFSTESITEDASTSLKMHQRGWRSAYFGMPMVAGLQPETFASFTVQRLRWAMGMMQILIFQNPLLVRGLSVAQRLAYMSVTLFWLFPFARVVFFIAPLLSLFLNLTIYPLGLEYFFAYTLPYLAAVVMSTERMFGRVRRFLTSELYETLQAFYAVPALLTTMLRPRKPSFKVTPKGEVLDREYISELHKPLYVFYAITATGLAWGIMRMVLEPASRVPLTLSVVWVCFNLVLLSGAMGVLLEKPQRRSRPRAEVNEVVTLVGDFGEREAMLVDINETSALIQTFDGERLTDFSVRMGKHLIPARPITGRGARQGVGDHVIQFELTNPAHERAVVQMAYGDSKHWQKVWADRESRINLILSGLGVAATFVRSGLAHVFKVIRPT